MLRIDHLPGHRPFNGAVVASGPLSVLALTRPSWLPRRPVADITESDVQEIGEEVAWLGWDAWVTLSTGR